MPATNDSDPTLYAVVVNPEMQYSIWPANREPALGWKTVGKTGTKDECLAYIKQVWTDMRPLSRAAHTGADDTDDDGDS